MNTNLVAHKAEKIAESYNADKIAPFPFGKVEESHPDLKIYLSEMEEGVSGAILYDEKDSNFKILVNLKKPKTRQYFTIAHELGHYFLHQNIIKKGQFLIDGDQALSGEAMLYRMDNAPSTEIEIEANQFAATLLMPEKLVRKAWKLINNVEECAELFKVSIVAMSIRLENLKLINND